MHLRTLKKLCKRAAPYLPRLGDERKQFPAGRRSEGECYIATHVSARKNADRFRGRLSPPAHPLKGTIMVGSMVGYYEPEWTEEDAWSALRELVHWGRVSVVDGVMVPPTLLRHPRDVFAAADLMLAGEPRP